MADAQVDSATNDMVASHYNAIPNRGVVAREDSRIIQMKNFNNWVKSVLIRTYCRSGHYVLDICGGKGGDLNKWSKGHIGYLVLADVALVSVQHAAERYNERNHNFAATFIAADCCAIDISDRLPDLDLISCQFALHYAFESEARARMILHNISAKLKPGGFFIGTIPDSNVIVKRIRHSDSLRFGNSVFSIEFDHKDDFPIFGCRYKFNLEDAIFALPEYLVHFPTLVHLAAAYDLVLLSKEPFHSFYERNIVDRENSRLFRNMHCLNSAGTISEDEWEASGLYITFTFQKKGASYPNPTPPPYPRPTRANPEDIIVLEK